MITNRWVALAAIACAACVTLCGWVSAEHADEDPLTPDAVSGNGERLYSAVQEVVGSEGWSSNKQWFSCGLNDGVAEVQLRLNSQLDAVLDDSPEDLATHVQEKWSTLGVKATLTVNTDLEPTRFIVSDPPFLTGTHEDGAITDLWIGEGIADFGYVSPCVPGDIFELQPSQSSSTPTLTRPSSP